MPDRYTIDPQVIIFGVALGISAIRSLLSKKTSQNEKIEVERPELPNFGTLKLPSALPPVQNAPSELSSGLEGVSESIVENLQEKTVVEKSPLLARSKPASRYPDLKEELRSQGTLKRAFVVSEILSKPKGFE